MFVILNVKASGRKKVKRGRTVDTVREYFTGGNDRFYIVDVLDSAQGVNWEEVAAFLGKHRKTVLLDRQYDFPKDSPLTRFEPKEFRNILIFNTVSMIFKELYLSGFRIRCCINDPAADCVPHLEKIVKYAAQTHILTENKFRFFAETEYLYNYYGAGITVSEKALADNDTIIIDTDNSFRYLGKGILFSSNGGGYSPLDIDGFGNIKALCPAYIAAVDFLGAVQQFNHADTLKDACLHSFLKNGTPVSVISAINDIKKHLWANAKSEKNTIFYV